MPQALQFLVLTFAGWLNRRQEDLIDYLREENRVLRQQLGSRPLEFSDAQRRRLAVVAEVVRERHRPGPPLPGRLLVHLREIGGVPDEGLLHLLAEGGQSPPRTGPSDQAFPTPPERAALRRRSANLIRRVYRRHPPTMLESLPVRGPGAGLEEQLQEEEGLGGHGNRLPATRFRRDEVL